MEDRVRPTKSGLFAIELLIAVGVFVFCAVVCLGVFARAELESRDSAELELAMNAARNAAECFKAAGGDVAEAADLCGGAVQDGALEWEVADGLLLRLVPGTAEGYVTGELSVARGETELLRWTVAALEVQP